MAAIVVLVAVAVEVRHELERRISFMEAFSGTDSK
jgi:hypothetical protein